MSASKITEEAIRKTSGDAGIISIIMSAVKKASVVGIVYLAGYMQWSVAWFIGPIVLFVIRDQWKKSSDKRRAIAKTTAMSSEKEVVLASLNDLPAWVFFPDIERVEWLNRILKQVWPNVNHYVRSIVRDSVQPELRKSLEKYKLSNFKFERIVLGSVPFRIGGVKVYDKNVDRNEIIMDIDIFYAGDCDITFSIASLKGGIRDFQLHGKLRVVMKPLISSMPLIGGLQVFFLNNPEINFDLIGIADVLDVPGLSDILRRIVVETVASVMVLPNKYSIKLSDEVEAVELKAPEPEGVLRVHLVEAVDLMKKDIGVLGKGKSDPYAVINVGAQEFKSKVIDNNINPKWNFWCEFEILESNEQQLYVHLWDKDGTGDDEKLGRATIEISEIVKKGYEDTWVALEQAKHGNLHLRLVWVPLSKDYSDLQTTLNEHRLFRPSHLSTALVTIFLDSAKNLPQPRMSTKPDPYAVLKVGNKTQQTNVLMRNIHPVWEEGFTFLVANPENDSIFLSIMDKKTSTEIGNLVFKIKNLCNKSNLEIIKEPFSLTKSGPDSKIVWSIHLRMFCGMTRDRILKDDPGFLERMETNKAIVSEADSRGSVQNDKEMEIVHHMKIGKDENILEYTGFEPKNLSAEDLYLQFYTPRSIIATAGKAGLGKIHLTLRYRFHHQKLIVIVHNVVNIPVKDPSNLPDPYVKLYLLPERAKDTKRKTQVVKDSCNPIFDEKFEYRITPAEIGDKELEITVGTQKQLFYSSNNILGQVIINLTKYNLCRPYTDWHDLQPEIDHD